jgi:DNA invertase Pin-like site-specific DNA recombinase
MTDSHDEWRQLNPFLSDPVSGSATTKRAALYARVARVSQADGSSSIEEQKQAARAFCQARGWSIVAEYVDAPASGMNENRHDFKRMVDDALTTHPFDVIVVYSYCRYFRNAFEAELYRRKLEKAGVELVSITQDFGEGPNADFARQVIALVDEYHRRGHVRRRSRRDTRA